MTIVRRRTRCGASSLRCYHHTLSRPPSETAVGVSCMDGLRCVMGEEEHIAPHRHHHRTLPERYVDPVLIP
jgi:hypothetical protein